MKNGHLYLLDLVEAGNYLNPVVSANPPDAIILQRVRTATNLSEDVVQVVSRKLTEIAGSNKVLSLSLLKAIEAHEWLMTDEELDNIGDEHSILKFNSADLVQVAIRRTPRIFIDQTAFQNLDIINRAALVLHEAVYALIKPISVHNENVQASWLVRAVLGQLFRRDFSTAGSKLSHDLEELLPVVSNEVVNASADTDWISDSEHRVMYIPTHINFNAPPRFNAPRTISFDKSKSSAEVINELAEVCLAMTAEASTKTSFFIESNWLSTYLESRRLSDGNAYIDFSVSDGCPSDVKINYNGTQSDCMEKMKPILRDQHYITN